MSFDAHRAWRQINFRRTGSLLAAEFLHGLYQRHEPLLNPFRFADTAVVFTPWQSRAYAPVEQWDTLAVRFGSRFLDQPERTCAELDRVLANTRPRSRELAAELDGTLVPELDDAALGDLLARTHHVPLGEIYAVNLVQVEHALHAAIRTELRARTGDPVEADRLLAGASQSAEPTVAAGADAAFLALVDRARAEGAADPERYRDELEAIVAEHRRVGAAYGADTADYAGLSARFVRYAGLPAGALPGARARTAGAAGGGGRFDDDPLLRRLFGALRRTGEVRDRNKSLLGTITGHRAALLDEVARRRGVPAGDVRLYLLEELLTLLVDRAEVPGAVVGRRRAEGVVLLRREGLSATGAAGLPPALLGQGPGRAVGGALRGLCASGGCHTGTVRVVSSAADLARMGVGDVLVAPGTDFDLILLLRMAGAVVTEEGGLLSHAAVVARELGIPCLISVPGATQELRDGETVTVDADAAVVRREAASTAEPAQVVAAKGAADVLVPVDAGAAAARIGRKADGLRTLAAAGLPVPSPVLAVPSAWCAAATAGLRDGDPGVAHRIAAALAAAFPGRRVSLRSSSLAEDTEQGTAAGVYHSEIDVPAEPEALDGALARVLASADGERAAAYHASGAPAPMAILVTPYLAFTHQGTAVSHSPWASDRVLVEYAESDGSGGCPDGGRQLHFPHAALGRPPGAAIPHLTGSLRRVAEAALLLAGRLDSPVEIEWGLNAEELTFLQVRRLVADGFRAPAASR
jgi:phosphohistidine swiveling domain-containing protein